VGAERPLGQAAQLIRGTCDLDRRQIPVGVDADYPRMGIVSERRNGARKREQEEEKMADSHGMIWWKDRIRSGEFLIYRPGRLHNVIPTFAVSARQLGWSAVCAYLTTYRDI